MINNNNIEKNCECSLQQTKTMKSSRLESVVASLLFFVIFTNSKYFTFFNISAFKFSLSHSVIPLAALVGNCLNVIVETKSCAFRLCLICQRCLKSSDGELHLGLCISTNCSFLTD